MNCKNLYEQSNVEKIMCYREVKCWVLKKYIFDTLVRLVLLYGVKYEVVSWLSMLGNTLKSVQKHVFTKFLQFKKQTPHTLLFLEKGSLPSEIKVMERFKKAPHIDFLELHGYVFKILCSRWMQDMEK